MKIVLPAQIASELEAQVLQTVPGTQIVYADAEGQTTGAIDDAEVLLRWFTTPQVLADLVTRMRSLRWLHIPRAGVESSLVPPVLERDILITNSAGAHAIPIAECVLLYMLCHAKRVPTLIQWQAEQSWGRVQTPLAELLGKTLLIVGLGQIGQAIAARAAAFGMRVLGSSRSGRPLPGFEQVVGHGEWRALLGEADYVVLATPLTPATRAMVGRAELAAMRPDSYLINIARGEIVDEEALIDALRSGGIAGAALDVFAQEPLPSNNPLWDAPNIFVTPHISWSSPEVRPRTLGLFVENLRRFVAGEPLINIVDKEAGY